MLITFEHFLLAVSHNMDVLDADELEFYIGVVVFVFVAFSCSSVCDRIQLERHLINHQSMLCQEQNNKKRGFTQISLCYIILIGVQQAHSQEVFCCEYIQLAKPI